jgi:type VI secretion system FHA domain protein
MSRCSYGQFARFDDSHGAVVRRDRTTGVGTPARPVATGRAVGQPLMPLILVLNAVADSADWPAPRRIVVDRQLSIGRGPDNDVILPDPTRFMSRAHCRIEASGSGYAVIDCSQHGVFLNQSGVRLSKGVPTPIHAGDRLEFAGYAVVVNELRPNKPNDQGIEIAPAPRHPFVDSMEDRPVGPPAGDTNGVDPTDLPSFGQDQSNQDQSNNGAFEMSRDALLKFPDERDEDWASGWRAAEPASHAAARPAEPADDLGDLKDLRDLSWARGPAPSRQEPSPPPMPDRGEKYPDPEILWPELLDQAESIVPADRSLIAALMTSAGLPDSRLNEAESVALMRRLGRMLAVLVPGLMRLLEVRRATKQEFHLERTTIAARDINALKLGGAPAETMRRLLLGEDADFLSLDEAVSQALKDLGSHEMGVIALMRESLKTVIGRFEPDTLEARLNRSSLLANILPHARKARYWEMFKTLHDEVTRELEEDLDKIFDADLVKAYQSQIDRLKQGGTEP